MSWHGRDPKLTWSCSTCGAETSQAYSYCRSCKNAYMRVWRKKRGPLRGEARRRDIARSYAHVYLKRGMLERRPCEVCGSLEVQMHHDDYDRPLDVRWLCRAHHRQEHRKAGTLTGRAASRPGGRLR